MTILIAFLVYVFGVIGFMLWYGFIGWGVELDGYENPSVALAGALWFISIPILMIIILGDYVKIKRDERIERELEKAKAIKRIRELAEKEKELAFQQIENDLNIKLEREKTIRTQAEKEIQQFLKDMSK